MQPFAPVRSASPEARDLDLEEDDADYVDESFTEGSSKAQASKASRPLSKRAHSSTTSMHRAATHRNHHAPRPSIHRKHSNEAVHLPRNASSKSVRILEQTEDIPPRAQQHRRVSPNAPPMARHHSLDRERLPPLARTVSRDRPLPSAMARSKSIERKPSVPRAPIMIPVVSRPSTASLTSLEPKSVIKGFEATPVNSVVDLTKLKGKQKEEPKEEAAKSELSFAKVPVASTSALKPVPEAGRVTPELPKVSIQPPTTVQIGKKSARQQKKSMFFISSPGSDSDGETIMKSLSNKSAAKKSSIPFIKAVANISAAYATSPVRPSSLRNESMRPKSPVPAEPVIEEDFVDEDEDSSGWGSEASSHSEPMASSAPSGEKGNRSMFLKRVPTAPGALNRVNSRTGLLTQLFKPSEEDEKAVAGLLRNPSTVGLVLAARSSSSKEALPARRGLQPSKSAIALPVMSYQEENAFPKAAPTRPTPAQPLGNRTGRLGGRPADVELSDSDEEDEDEEGKEEGNGLANISPTQKAAFNAAMARYQARHIPVAGPQTPRTTRRNMLSTELSESLRLGLLWDRQTTMKLLGKPSKLRIQSNAQQVQPQFVRRHTACNGELQPHRTTATASESNLQRLGNTTASNSRTRSEEAPVTEQPFSDGFHHA